MGARVQKCHILESRNRATDINEKEGKPLKVGGEPGQQLLQISAAMFEALSMRWIYQGDHGESKVTGYKLGDISEPIIRVIPTRIDVRTIVQTLQAMHVL